MRFPAYSQYTGQDAFFPDNLQTPVKYRRVWLPDGGSEKEARNAIIRFCVTVALLNQRDEPENYSMLFHRSGKKAQHEVDTATIERLVQDLLGHIGPVFEALAKEAFDVAQTHYPSDSANTLAAYVVGNIWGTPAPDQLIFQCRIARRAHPWGQPFAVTVLHLA